jgi:hypothetical protein
MTREIIASILEREGATSKSGALTIPSEKDATCFISTPGDLFAIARVVRAELLDHHVVLTTAKEERFAFAYQDVLGFKVSPAAAQSKDRSAGFGR